MAQDCQVNRQLDAERNETGLSVEFPDCCDFQPQTMSDVSLCNFLGSTLDKAHTADLSRLMSWLARKGYTGFWIHPDESVSADELRQVFVDAFPELPEKRKKQILAGLAAKLDLLGYQQDAMELRLWEGYLDARLEFHSNVLRFLAHALHCLPTRPQLPTGLSSLTLTRLEPLTNAEKKDLLTSMVGHLADIGEIRLSSEGGRLIRELELL